MDFRQEFRMRSTLFALAGFGLMALAGTAHASEDMLQKFMADARPAQAQFTQKDEQGVAK